MLPPVARHSRSGAPTAAHASLLYADGRRVVSESVDKMMKLWDTSTGQEVLVFSAGNVRDIAFSPDGRLIASSSVEDRTVKVWNGSTGQEMLTLKKVGLILSVVFSPDSRRIIVGGLDGAVKVWDVSTGQEMLTLRGDTAPVFSLAFSADGRRMVSGGGGGMVGVWDARDVTPELRSRARGRGAVEFPFPSPYGKTRRDRLSEERFDD